MISSQVKLHHLPCGGRHNPISSFPTRSSLSGQGKTALNRGFPRAEETNRLPCTPRKSVAQYGDASLKGTRNSAAQYDNVSLKGGFLRHLDRAGAADKMDGRIGRARVRTPAAGGVSGETTEEVVHTEAAQSNGVATSSDVSAVEELSLETQILHFKNEFDPYGAMSTPIYQTATFSQLSATDVGEYDYTRSGNPTRDALEKLLARVEGATRALVFSTGMAALATVTRLVTPGQEIVAADDIYGGTDRLLSRIVSKFGIVVKRVDTSNLDAVRAAVTPTTRLILMESPTNPRMQISDIRAIAEIAHANDALLCVDNSIMSPALSRPLDMGADIVMHSGTKFIAGHSDVMAGVLAVRDESLGKDIYFLQNAEGTGLSPFDSWLLLRGVKTMVLRIEKQQANAEKIARYLASHPRIVRVNYAGLPTHPGYEIHLSQCKGGGSVLSFATGSLAVSKHIVETTKLFSVTVSFGSVSSLINLPCFSSHASIPAEVRQARGLTEDLVRISVGIEDVDDLIADLDQALQSAPAA